jgi:hypothetical protein
MTGGALRSRLAQVLSEAAQTPCRISGSGRGLPGGVRGLLGSPGRPTPLFTWGGP